MASTVFYELYRQGKLDNGGYELTEDLGMWAGAYEIKLDREQRFLELSREYMSSLKTKGTNLTPFRLYDIALQSQSYWAFDPW